MRIILESGKFGNKMQSFEGKGGSGKSTVAYLLALCLTAKKRNVLMIDADLNLAQSKKLQLEPSPRHTFGSAQSDPFGRYVHQGNQRIRAAVDAGLHVPKMAPPGVGSRLVGFDDSYLRTVMRLSESGVFLIDPGKMEAVNRGTHCWHFNLGAIEQALIHFVERPGEHVLVDMTAGDDEATALHSLFDVRIVVVEPAEESTDAATQIIEQAMSRGHRFLVVGNKIEEDGDVIYLHEWLRTLTHQPNVQLAAALPKSSWVKEMSRGGRPSFASLDEQVKGQLDRLAVAIETLGHDNQRRMADVARIYQSNVEEFQGADPRLLEVLQLQIEGRVLDAASAAGFTGELTVEAHAALSATRVSIQGGASLELGRMM